MCRNPLPWVSRARDSDPRCLCFDGTSRVLRDVCGLQVLGKVLQNLVLGLGRCSGCMAAAGRAGDFCNFRKESVGILNNTQESKQ